jgi:hypothetical protein
VNPRFAYEHLYCWPRRDILRRHPFPSVPDGFSVGSMDVDEELDFGLFPVQAATDVRLPRWWFESPSKLRRAAPHGVDGDVSSMRKGASNKETRRQSHSMTLRLLVKNKQQGVKISTEGRTVVEMTRAVSYLTQEVADPSLLRALPCTIPPWERSGILHLNPGAASRILLFIKKRFASAALYQRTVHASLTTT